MQPVVAYFSFRLNAPARDRLYPGTGSARGALPQHGQVAGGDPAVAEPQQRMISRSGPVTGKSPTAAAAWPATRWTAWAPPPARARRGWRRLPGANTPDGMPALALAPLVLVVVLLLGSLVMARRRSYPVGGMVVVRCNQGHLFTTMWVPLASFK